MDLVSVAGYTAEEHQVETEDGYLLGLHRITGGPQVFAGSGKPVVLLVHPLLGASDVWVVRGPNYDFGILQISKKI